MSRFMTVTVQLGRTFNTGNYESTRVDCGLTWEVEEDADRDAIRAEMATECKRAILAVKRQISQPEKGTTT